MRCQLEMYDEELRGDDFIYINKVRVVRVSRRRGLLFVVFALDLSDWRETIECHKLRCL